MCGENATTLSSKPIKAGSPPRVRGKRSPTCSPVASKRITPACAGKTRPPPLAHLTQKDHPRVCGENGIHKMASAPLGGSPPRVRGKPVRLLRESGTPGITPACAGKTAENLTSKPFRNGSPPRVRGKRTCTKCINRCLRITPACAGKTASISALLLNPQDHPRVCGENSSFILRFSLIEGSPPRVRGKPIVLYGASCFRRITPACAGKTCCSPSFYDTQ